jgi:putative acetyltransferase
MHQLIRTDSANTHFKKLAALLDQDLALRDGADHTFYAQFNKVDHIHHVVLVYQHDETVACGAFKPFEEKTVEIKRMYVLPEQRGKGIAAMVLQELENWAAEMGCNFCVLETGRKQPEAIGLYQKTGYEIIPNYGQYQGIENSVCMKKMIRL